MFFLDFERSLYYIVRSRLQLI